MLRATILLELTEDFILSEVSSLADGPVIVTNCEVLGERDIRFVVNAGDKRDEMAARLETSDVVAAVEFVGDDQLLITKRSSGALPIIRENHGRLQRMSQFYGTSRVFDIVVFRRADLKQIIAELRTLGTVELRKLKPFAGPSTRLSPRQAEIIGFALEHGYFDWPRRITVEAIAAEFGLTRPTVLEHLRKAEKKLLSDALADATTRTRPDHQ
ncbi:helix-turn-helix domain-containing protein [Haloferax namakaokahaiae]|uniref:Helix-turn-helix domain-containing protein n=1 Tax=Haloferax namakaokahaiae TaxID=1748331 RepID=A0ABD5ZE03_9EURY